MAAPKGRNKIATETKTLRVGDAAPDFALRAHDGTEVTLCTVDGGGHSWPGGPALQGVILGYTSPYLKASDLILDFFFAHPMP